MSNSFFTEIKRAKVFKVGRETSMRVFIAIVLLLIVTDTLAYLDPGTGSMLLQVILGGVAAVGVVIKLYWHRLRAALGMARKEDPEDES